MPFGEHRGVGGAEDDERWLLDAARVVFGERQLQESGHFLGEERVRVGDCLLEGPGQPVVECGPVAGSEDAAEGGRRCLPLLPGRPPRALDSGLDDVCAEPLPGIGGRGGPRGSHEGEGVHGLGAARR
jgi:hypothetical protein